MTVAARPSGDFPDGLDQIETDWSLVHEPAYIVLRYSSAIQGYLRALIRNGHDAEEVGQDFFLWVSEHGFPRISKDRGRFRDYLKKVIRNTAVSFLRRPQGPKLTPLDISQIPEPEEAFDDPDEKWLAEWRQCILQRAWKRLRDHQRKSRNNLACKVLRLCAAHPGENSEALAERMSKLLRKPMRADAFRKQLSRARHKFAFYLVDEIVQTLDDPEPSDVEDELADLHLIKYVREFLPLRRRISPSR
jgi:RNA polymerase sigma factor (sigma-70 family)